IYLLPSDVSFLDAVHVAGAFGRLKAVDFSFDWNNRYNFWSGIIGGMFLALSYFGTDQSQVQRYLTGRSVAQSRLGLIFNGLAKVPMQFFILFVGAMVFVFYQFITPPIFFNPVEQTKIEASRYATEFKHVEHDYQKAVAAKRDLIRSWIAARHSGQNNEIDKKHADLLAAQKEADSQRQKAIA